MLFGPVISTIWALWGKKQFYSILKLTNNNIYVVLKIDYQTAVC